MSILDHLLEKVVAGWHHVLSLFWCPDVRWKRYQLLGPTTCSPNSHIFILIIGGGHFFMSVGGRGHHVVTDGWGAMELYI